MKKLLLVLLLSGTAFAAASDNRLPTATCALYIRAKVVRASLRLDQSKDPLDKWALAKDLDFTRAVSCAADPKLAAPDRLLWAQALQELIERRYEQDLAEAIK